MPDIVRWAVGIVGGIVLYALIRWGADAVFGAVDDGVGAFALLVLGLVTVLGAIVYARWRLRRRLGNEQSRAFWTAFKTGDLSADADPQILRPQVVESHRNIRAQRFSYYVMGVVAAIFLAGSIYLQEVLLVAGAGVLIVAAVGLFAVNLRQVRRLESVLGQIDARDT